MFRKFFLKIHLWLGLSVGLLFALAGLSGSLLVFSEEADAALNARLLHVAPRAENARFGQAAAAVLESYPDERIWRIKMPRGPGETYEFWMGAGGDRRVYVDPYTGEILGERHFSRSLRGTLFLLHTQLLAGETGKNVIGAAAFFFLLIGISGIVLWWRGARNLKRGLTINVRSGWKRANYDAHHAIGFFAFFFLSISAFTGIHLVFNVPFEKTFNRLTGTPSRPPAPTSQAAEGAVTVSFDEILDRADRIWPQATTTWIYPPAGKTAAYMIRKKFPSENHPNGKSFMYFDQYTGEVLRLENAEEAPAVTRAINNLYPLHIGIMGGTATRLLQVLIGLTPSILLVTGFLMWRSRSRKKVQRR